jgi:hypothetical protein
MSETSELKREIAELEDEALQKRFAALFDDGQGANARDVFVNYCRSRGYHPSEMSISYGKNMFQRQRNMIKRLEKLLDEDRTANRFLFNEVSRRLKAGETLKLPPNDARRSAAVFQRLIARKFGTSSQARKLACQALHIGSRQFSRLSAGMDISDGFIELIEELPDQPALTPARPSKKKVAQISDPDYVEFERKFSYIAKPKKNTRDKSSMTPEELRRSVGTWPLGENWIERLASFSLYSPFHLQHFVKGGDSRPLTMEIERFIRQVNQALQDSGGVRSRVR